MAKPDKNGLYDSTAASEPETHLGLIRHSTKTSCTSQKGDPTEIYKFTTLPIAETQFYNLLAV